MARQVLPLIDLRTQAQRQGITSLQQTSQAIADILQGLNKAEQTRREREDLDSITRAIAGGKTITEAIASVVEQKREFDPGIQGILQKIGGAGLQGGIGKDLQRAIVGGKLTQALKPKKTPTIAQQRATEALRVGAVPGTPEFEKIAKGPKVGETPEKRLQFWQDRLQKTVDAIGSPLPGQEKTVRIARKKISQALKQIEKQGDVVIETDEPAVDPKQIDTKGKNLVINKKTGKPQKVFSREGNFVGFRGKDGSLVTGEKKAFNRDIEFSHGTVDEIFAREADEGKTFEKTLQNILAKTNKQGFDKESVTKAFTEWWNENKTGQAKDLSTEELLKIIGQ